MRTITVCILIMAGGTSVEAQHLNSRLYQDSLRTAIATAGNDSARAVLAFQLSETLASRDTVQAAHYLGQAQRWAGRHPLLKALYPYYSGVVLARNKGQEAIKQYRLADSLLEPFDDSLAFAIRSKALHRYGAQLLRQDDPGKFADIILNKAIPLARRSGDSTLIGKHFLGIGYVFYNHGQYDIADGYMRTALRVLRGGHAPPEQQIVNYIALAENLSEWDHNDEVPEMLDSARAMLAPYPESDHWVDFYAAEGLYFNEAKDYKSALASLEKGIAVADRLHIVYEKQRLQLQQYYALHRLGSYKEALRLLEYLMRQPEMMGIVTNRLLVYEGMANTTLALGNARSAWEWQKQYSDVSDSFHASRLKNEISALEVRYRNAENQEKIARLEAENRQAQLAGHNARLQFWLLAAVSFIVLASAVFFIFQYRSSRKVARQKLKEMEQSQMLATSQAMLEGEERERRRVARDLHDGLGGMLAGMKIRLSGMASGGEDNALFSVIGQLDHSVNELRRIARNMMPENLLKFGLDTALGDLCESMSTPATHIRYQSIGMVPGMPVQTQVTIYRIVQEALANAIRHADAREVLLQCSQDGSLFFITIEDDGKGFALSEKEKAGGTGLANIRNRVHYLKGKLDITSVINEGTAINIELHVETDS